jgi:hypothetical protein
VVRMGRERMNKYAVLFGNLLESVYLEYLREEMDR